MYKTRKKSKVVWRERVGHCIGCKHWRKEKAGVIRARHYEFFKDFTNEEIEEYYGICDFTHLVLSYWFFCGFFKRGSKIFYK